MKKSIVTMALALAATNINAQLVVDSLGRVGIGTDSVKSMLAIGTIGSDNSAMCFYTKSKRYTLSISNDFNSSDYTYGVSVNTRNHVGKCFGLRSTALGINDMEQPQCAIGIGANAGRAKTAVGLFGGRSIGETVNFAGVFGTETTGITPTFSTYSGIYAGFFKGKVRVTNGIYATVLSPSASPLPSGQNGATILSDRGESVTDKLSQVQALQFLRYDPTQEVNTSKTSLDDIDIDNISQEELDSLAEAMGDIESERYLSPVQYGLDADQLKEVYPELVYEDANGNVSINYVEMVPLLVQCINELSAKVAELEGTSPRKAKAQPTAIEETVSDVDMVRMDQNKPNPFSESTVITLNIPSNAQVSTIFIYDMSGKQMQSLPVSERGETNITVYAADLAAGMYIYTLVIDGKVAVTRRMIVSKI